MGSENVCAKLIIDIREYYNFRIVIMMKDQSNDEECA
jgi:hypothetical protein